ncbi:MAG: 5-formyltetrahydrofolate cyclo-ligase [Candidatus Binatia bacterium]
MTKDAIRQKVWTRVITAGVARFPGAQGRVPNFVGAERAARLLSQLTIWKRAKVVKCDLSAPQLPLRRAALADGKILYLPLPGLRAERCFLEIDPSRLGSRPWRAASLRSALRWGRPVAPHELHPIDLVVVGSVAVSRQGARVGRGSGAADLEYALLRRAGKVREYTPIVTTIHPLQLVDDRITMRAHDIPVDFLITPDQVVAAPSLYPRPRGILWDLLPDERIRAIPALRKGRREGRGTLTPGQI